MADIHKGSSFYSQTPIKDFYLDIWQADAKEMPPSLDDTQLKIESKYHNRPDLLSYDLFGDPALWWVFTMRNKDILIDPINDFVSGMTIWIPASMGKS